MAELGRLRRQVADLERELGLIDVPLPQATASDAEREAWALVADLACDLVSVHRANGDYLYASPSVTALLGWAPEQLVGRNAYEFFHPEDLERIAADHHAHEGNANQVRYRIATADGGWRWVETRSRARLEDDVVTHIVCSTHDVQQQVDAEREIAATTEELRRSNQELERFAYGLSHDLAAPLRIVLGLTEQLGASGPALDARTADLARRASEASERMQRMIRDLLDYARVAAPGRTPSRVSLDDVLDTALANLAHPIERTGPTVGREPASLPEVVGEASQLVRLLQNLVANALAHAGERPPEVTVRCVTEEAHWRIEVDDRGVGFPDEDRERIFDLFHRAGPEQPGTGIGLATCKRIAEAHGGTIAATSEPGCTRFAVSLPRPPPR